MASPIFIAVIGIFAIFIAFYLVNHLRLQWLHRNIGIKQNCQPPPHFPHFDPILGLDLFLQTIKNAKEKHRMESTKKLFDRYGLTWQSISFGRQLINTIDPENIQSVMASDFESWGLAPLRYPAAGPFIGRGVVTSDGPFWQYAR